MQRNPNQTFGLLTPFCIFTYEHDDSGIKKTRPMIWNHFQNLHSLILQTTATLSMIQQHKPSNIPNCTLTQFTKHLFQYDENSKINLTHTQYFFFNNVATFLKKSPLDSPLASSKTYGQLTPPARTSCQVIQRIIFEWEYSSPSGLKSPLTG